MKKPEFDTSSLGSMSIDQVEQHNREMREKASPEVRGYMDEVQSAVDEENRQMNKQFALEQRLRDQFQELCGVPVDITEIEYLRDVLKTLEAGDVYKFIPKRKTADSQLVKVLLYKTSLGTIDRLDRYVYTLEKTVIDLSTKTPSPQFTETSFFGLIKLAFSQLFKRSN